VIARADGSVLYNFAVAIDDLDAAITHVVRGEDHLSNTPKQLLVLQAAKAVGFGAETPEPTYAHLPLLHGPDGKKLSKRHGAASVQELRDAGYLPEAVRNYLALLGWGSGDDATVMSTAELVERFDLERVSRNPARFDEVKLRWLDGIYLRGLPVPELADRLVGFLRIVDPQAARAVEANRVLLEGAVAISQEKIQTLADFWPLVRFFFVGVTNDEAARERWLGERGATVLGDARKELSEAAGFDVAGVEAALASIVERHAVKPREVYQPLRVAIAGTTVSPGIFESVALLGREETLRRIDTALA
jgi:glutamyl-tRNA synthetase